MSMISHQVEELREFKKILNGRGFKADILAEAADTIESLSAKLSAANMERSERYYKMNEIIERLEAEADEANDKMNFGDFEDRFYLDGKEDGIRLAIELIRSLAENKERYYGGGWIACNDRLPEEDGFYIATLDGEIIGGDEPFSGMAEFENGKWVDDEEDCKCVLAWMQKPTPYHPKEGATNVEEKKTD